MDSKNIKKVFGQSPVTVKCLHCGEPMLKARGTIVKEFDKDEKQVGEFVNKDQRVYFHKKCRKEGRRLALKRLKWLRKEKKNHGK